MVAAILAIEDRRFYPASRRRSSPYRRGGLEESPGGANRRGWQHDHPAARPSVAVVSRPHLRAQDSRNPDCGTARRALLQAADTRGVSQHGLFRRGLLRGRGRIARILRQVGRGSRCRRRRPARGTGAIPFVRRAGRVTGTRHETAQSRAHLDAETGADQRARSTGRSRGPRFPAASTIGSDRADGDRSGPACTSRKKSGDSFSRCLAPTGCCAAACACSPPTTRRCSAKRSDRLRLASRRWQSHGGRPAIFRAAWWR